MNSALPSMSSNDFVHVHDNQNLKNIPGDEGWPLMGEVLELFNDQSKLMQKHYDNYGEISRINLRSQRGVLCLGPDLAKEILLDAGNNYSS